jgi:hypothetical protein
MKELLTYTHSQLVLLRQLIHTQNGNDILEGLVILQNLLDSSRNLVMLLANLLPAMSDLKIRLTLRSLQFEGPTYGTSSQEGRRQDKYRAQQSSATTQW